ncbi:MAG: EAL domain-containing protein [Pseudomonadota bacterium]
MRVFPRPLAHRLLAGTLMLTLAVVCVVSLALFANGRLIVDRFLNDSVTSNGINLESEFELRARQAATSLEREVDNLARDGRLADLQTSLDESVSELGNIDAVQFIATDGRVAGAAGNADGRPIAPVDEASVWSDSALRIDRTVLLDGTAYGELRIAFSLDALNAQKAQFREQQIGVRAQWQSSATSRVLLTSLVVALICGALSWLAARRIVRPIEAIKEQAEGLRAGDYGKPLALARDDEVGQLANAFDEMRDQLRRTTISRDYMDNVLSSLNDALIVTDNDGVVMHCNSAAVRLTGYTETELLGKPIAELVHEDDLPKLMRHADSQQPREARFITATEEQVPVSWMASRLNADDNVIGGRVYSAQNISERKRSEERIRYLARIDPMTKVPNRMQFQHLLQRAIAHARRKRKAIVLLYVDLDQFKDVNDTFGHLAGDTTLEVLAKNLRKSLPDGVVVGRLSGDEFAAFIEGEQVDEHLRERMNVHTNTLLETIAEPFDVQGNEVYVTASVGIAIYPDDADNVIDLLRNADAALYAAKKAGGNRAMYYDSRMNDDAVERLMMKSRLRRSFERDELLLRYQPKYELATGKVVGAEALVRWEMPGMGRVQPNDFIPLAEETNLIIQIGEWVMDKVCADIAEWKRDVGEPGRIAINLSLKQLRQRNFFNSVNQIFSRHHIRPEDIEFEITETTLMEDIPRTVAVLEMLQSHGLQLAIDDFGTGYSSFSALQKFPIKTLKIDRSFVSNAAEDQNDAAIISAIVEMSRKLDLDVVAEGVENEAQLALLRRMRCNFGQGMLFGKPMSAAEFGQRMIEQQDGTDRHRALFA